MSDGANGQVQQNFRKRISLACNGCRLKRTKCDGHGPQCSACKYRGEECEYSRGESKRKRPSNAYVMALEARVASLEKMLATMLEGSENPEFERPAFASTLSDKANDEAGEQDSVDQLTDALGCFTLGDTGELRFFGASSNFSIIQNNSLRVASSVDARSRGIAAARNMANFFEPSDELRDHLLALYWRWQNSWQYIVARESFVMDLYIQNTGRFCTPLLLTSILAYASRYSSRLELRTDPMDANTAGEALANQARTMLHYEYEAPTTSTVQAAALLGLYWASIDREGLGFMYIGMATRMAMNLGLHLDCSAFAAQGIISVEDVEARKIAFWGIYVLDKLYSLGMGRPASIHEFNITTSKPKAQDLPMESLSMDQLKIHQPWPTSYITNNSMQTCEIFMITSEVIDQLYAQRPTWTDKERDDRITQTHLRLVKWFDGLPKSLKMSESSLQPSPPFVYQLHLQYHVSIILLHRPFFKTLNRGQGGGEYDPNGNDVHSRSCQISAAKIASIFRIYKNNYTNRCVPISAVHPAFTAAIIHLLHIKTADPSAQSKAIQLLRICLTSLFEMNINWDWANRSIRAIKLLANEWELDIWDTLQEEVNEESRLQFERYEKSCLQSSHRLYLSDNTVAEPLHSTDPFNEVFDTWLYEQGLMDGTLHFSNVT